jgi:hypothetical protein
MIGHVIRRVFVQGDFQSAAWFVVTQDSMFRITLTARTFVISEVRQLPEDLREVAFGESAHRRVAAMRASSYFEATEHYLILELDSAFGLVFGLFTVLDSDGPRMIHDCDLRPLTELPKESDVETSYEIVRESCTA